MSLDELSKKYKLDKNISSGCHNYIPGYTSIFEDVRYDIKTVLEIGIGSIENGQMGGVISMGYKTGNSLKCWSEYFSNSIVYGIDIYEHKELNTDKIKKIGKYKKVKKSDTGLIELDCPICIENIYLPVVLDTGHMFCKPCIDAWFVKNSTNPMTNLKISKKYTKMY